LLKKKQLIVSCGKHLQEARSSL